MKDIVQIAWPGPQGTCIIRQMKGYGRGKWFAVHECPHVKYLRAVSHIRTGIQVQNLLRNDQAERFLEELEEAFEAEPFPDGKWGRKPTGPAAAKFVAILHEITVAIATEERGG